MEPKKKLKGRSARLGSVKKKEKRKKEREKINLIKEERNQLIYIYLPLSYNA